MRISRRRFMALSALYLLSSCQSSGGGGSSNSRRELWDDQAVLNYFSQAYLTASGLTAAQVKQNFLQKFANGYDEKEFIRLIKSDYSTGTTINLNNWTLSVTEAQGMVFLS